VFAAFRQSFVKSTELTNASKMLFKITVDEGTKTKSVCWLGVPHVTTFAVVLDLLNKKFSGNGAFLLKGGYGIRPQQSAGQIFMKYGYEIEFHPKVDLTRIAWHQRG
jgi:Ubiquitin fold modifier 1 protein